MVLKLMNKYRVLKIDNYQEYLYKTYSSWLGKVIGVRLGAATENWPYEKVRGLVGKHFYPVDYGIFAADDDINGPLFYVRTLLDNINPNSEDFGNNLLNYVQNHNGFFWWGGSGISSENTAFDNLKNGIKAPISGSIKQNGKTIAEQIGGQIFSDCWGYVSGFDPYLAMDLAAKASSVTHDGDGIEGGKFVAAAITLAYQYDNIYDVVIDALDLIDHNSHYYKVMQDIVDFYEKNPNNMNLCHEYIREYYGYDSYPGICHIIPNSCLMIMAMLYGNNDFSKTLESLNCCGWDTDCNCGNVGSIMGALVGVNNIDERWIKPINDIINASSCVGSLNIQTISESAKLFTYLAYKLKGIDIVDNKHFDLPYASEGFIGECKVDNGLICKNEVYKYTYYKGEDLYDARYDPEFSPIIYPGYTISVKADKDIQVFVEDINGNRYYGNNFLTVPTIENLIVHKLGFVGDNYKIYDYKISYTPSIEYDLVNIGLDLYGPRFLGDSRINIRGFVRYEGEFNLCLGLTGTGMISSGHINDQYNELIYDFNLYHGKEFYLLFNMSGYMHYNAIGIKNDEIIFIRKDVEEKIIKRFNYLKPFNRIHLKNINNKIYALIDGIEYDLNLNGPMHSLIGFYAPNDTNLASIKLKIG